MMGDYIVAVQPNGERIRFERWVWERWRDGALRDQFLRRYLTSAVRFYESHQ